MRCGLAPASGIAVFPEDASDAEGLCIAADLRMYDFKNGNGRHGRPNSPTHAGLPFAH